MYIITLSCNWRIYALSERLLVCYVTQCSVCSDDAFSRKILLVTADDFGYDCDRNRGILECFQKHTITRASVLVNGTACSEAFALANLHNIPLGQH